MSDKSVDEKAARALELEEELETAGDALTDAETLAFVREVLHEWADTVVGATAAPGVGRVTLIHKDGHQSKISSPSLPFKLTRPARFDAAD